MHPARTRLLEVRSFSRLQTVSIFQQVKKSKLVYSGICRKPQSWDKKKYGAYVVLKAKQKNENIT